MISPRLGSCKYTNIFSINKQISLINRQNNARAAINHPGVAIYYIVDYSSPANSMSVSWR